jgi:glycerophosphoryl diester phosphodiesterase
MSFKADIAWLVERPIAHRGYHDMNRTVWENTLPAFQRAIDQNFAIECDVRLAGDGEIVVFHDNDLRRLTGREGFVWQKTGDEMTALTIGDTSDHAPRLAELLALVDGRVPLVIELKGAAGHDDGLLETLGAMLSGYRGKVAVMSFNHWLVRGFKRVMPDIPRGLTAWGTTVRDIEAHFSMLAHDIDFVSFDVEALDNAFVRFVRERLGMPVITWTVQAQPAVTRTFELADQMTFEGFDPDTMAYA